MTAKEAIEILKTGRDAYTYNCTKNTNRVLNAYNMAIEALEKQIVKKPRQGKHLTYCPSCGNPVDWMYHCSHCGQKVCEVEE